MPEVSDTPGTSSLLSKTTGESGHKILATAETKTITNELFELQVEPHDASLDISVKDLDSFLLTIKNKTNEEIEIDWSRSYFMENGQTQGGCSFHLGT